MSAYVCSPKTIGIVAQRVIEKYQGAEKTLSVPELAENMAILNIESVDYRYAEKTSEKELKQFILDCRTAADSTENSNEKISDERLLGAVSCFLYQSCESEACVKSETYRMVQRLEKYLEGNGVKSEGWGF